MASAASWVVDTTQNPNRKERPNKPMKNWTIASNLAALSLGALISACGAAETSVGSDQPGLESTDVGAAAGLGEAHEALTMCDDPQYDHWRYISGLAVAAGTELGRWNLNDFTLSNGVQLSASGLARCSAASKGCQNVQALLSLQNNGGGVIARHDPALYKQYLVNFYNDQYNWNKSQGVNDFSLVPTTVTTASCGFRYWFKASVTKTVTTTTPGTTTTTSTGSGTTTLKNALSGKCMDVSDSNDGTQVMQMPCDGSGEQNLVLEQVSGAYRLKNNQTGKCYRVSSANLYTILDQAPCGTSNNFLFDLVAAGDKFQFKTRISGQCAEIGYWTTLDGGRFLTAPCNGAFPAQQFSATIGGTSTTTTPGTTTTSVVTTDVANPALIKESLRWVGGNTNPYIQFMYSGSEVSVDPMGTMVDGGSTGQTGSCIEASSAFDSSRQLSGKCCTYSGKYGTFAAAAWNASLFYCK